MKRSVYIAVIISLVALAGCEQKEDKIVSPAAQAPQTAEETQQPARLDTAMKSSQESAAAVDQARMATESGMKEATASMAKKTETTVKTEAATTTVTDSAEQKVSEQVKTMPVAKQTATTVPTSKETVATATKPVEAAMAGDAAKGATLAKKRCSMCHNFDSTKRKVGPGLKGVFGRTPSITGVPFAKWDAAALDKWLTKPKAVKKNTKMAFPGFPNKSDRDDVIAYLKTL